MNEPNPSADFGRTLIAQDALVNSTDFARLRAQVRQRVARAQRRERLARYVTLFLGCITLVAIASLVATKEGVVGHSARWPEWVENTAEVCFLLLPPATLLLSAIYVLHHYRELQKARRQANDHTLADLERQLAELKQLFLDQRPTEVNPPLPGNGSSPPKPCPPGATVRAGEKPGPRNGFTLMEMLVVVAILALLAALIMTGLAAAKISAKRAVCQSNLNQLGLALALYVSEFHANPGTWPGVLFPGRRPDTNPPSPETYTWDGRLAPYLGRVKGVMYCPSHVFSAREVAWYGGQDYRANYNYGYNGLGDDRLLLITNTLSAGGWMVTPVMPSSNLGLGCIVLLGAKLGVGIKTSTLAVPDAKVAVPAEMIAIADRKGGDQWTTPVVGPGDPGVRFDNDPGDQHRGGANVLFCDGHLEYRAQARWKEKSEAARCRWNNDHQPHRETW